MFDIVDTAFSYKRELIVFLFLQEFSKEKGSSLQSICYVHTTFLLCGADYCTPPLDLIFEDFVYLLKK